MSGLSSAVSAGTNATAAQYNNLRTDTLGVRPQWNGLSAAFPTTNAPEFKSNNGTDKDDYSLDYDDTTQESAGFDCLLPTDISINQATAYVVFRMASAVTGGVVWQLIHHTAGDGEAWDAAGTTEAFSAKTVPGTAGMVAVASKALTISAWTAGEQLNLKLSRKVGDAGDTASGDAKFMRMYLRIL